MTRQKEHALGLLLMVSYQIDSVDSCIPLQITMFCTKASSSQSSSFSFQMAFLLICLTRHLVPLGPLAATAEETKVSRTKPCPDPLCGGHVFRAMPVQRKSYTDYQRIKLLQEHKDHLRPLNPKFCVVVISCYPIFPPMFAFNYYNNIAFIIFNIGKFFSM